MKTYTADKTCVNILRAVALLLLAGIIVATTYLRPFPIVMTILLAVFSALCLFGGGIWLPLWLKSVRCELSDCDILFASGVFFRNRTVMKISAVRHITLIKTPFSKFTGLNFVSVSALGGGIVLPFLSLRNAEEIVADIRQHTGREL